MKDLNVKFAAIDWQKATVQMNEKGYNLIPGLLSGAQCNEIIHNYNNADLYRKIIIMERYRFGLGEYKYFKYPLPALIQNIRAMIYPQLAIIANGWMSQLDMDHRFPATLSDLQKQCQANDQTQPTILILKYGKGGHNALHQDLYGEIFFPIQVVLFLNEPGKDFTGGEFVMTEQVPRAQSKAIVLTPKKGDMLMFTTNFRPVKGSRGYYRVNMKHGVSELHEGERHSLGIIFHDAKS